MDGILTAGSMVTPAGAFAINGNDLYLRHPEYAFDPAHKAGRKHLRLDQTEHSPKGIVGRNPIRQFQKASHPADFGLPIRLNLTPRVRPTEYGTHSDKDDVN